uniref:2',3'-cyclic nucleotide 3' phosphodiesterase n=1 Tax=Amphilophus citrinellus TaxID=61819 RepID=A0A3Q0RLZ5_AMPCI
MDTEKSGEVLGASETPQQEETAVEKEAVETPVESTEPEKSPAAEETTGQMAVNGHQSEAINVKETEELIGTMPEENDPVEKSDADSVPGAKALQQPEESSEKKISEQQPVPENDPESLALQTPLAESAPEPEPAKAAESVPEIKGQTLPESAVVQPPDLALLTKKTKRGLEEAHLAAMKGPLEEVSIPLYFGWFLLFSVKNKIKCTSMDFLKTLDTLDAFKKHSVDFTGKAEKEVDLEQYFKPAGILHCTTKFCDYGKAEGAKEYAENQAVIKSYGSISDLSLSAFFVTPRTCGARVYLTEEQLQLWPADAEKQAEPVPEAAASLPLGSRAHITLGCAEGVEPVQTGIDLLEILAQQESQQGELVEEMELGSLTYYGEGKWLLNLREPICVPACFSSIYGRKEPEPTKKDPEKKKKPKCAIL